MYKKHPNRRKLWLSTQVRLYNPSDDRNSESVVAKGQETDLFDEFLGPVAPSEITLILSDAMNAVLLGQTQGAIDPPSTPRGRSADAILFRSRV